MMAVDKTTPLYNLHLALGGKMISFGGFLMPVEYKAGLMAEHMAVRNGCGLFDTSHMGEILCKGPDALKNLNYILTNDFDTLAVGRARYSPMCNQNGGVVDDLIVYRLGQEEYMLVVNAANTQKDFEHLRALAAGEVVFEDASENWALISLQGPRARALLEKLELSGGLPGRFAINRDFVIGGIDCMLARTGYTGEDGFEVYTAPGDAAAMWNTLLLAGEEFGALPCGLGARDTLRLEAGLVLYGQELGEDITPLEAGLGRFVKLDKPDFVGKKALLTPPGRELVGLRVTGRGIVRNGMDIFKGDEKIGTATSGTHLPYLKAPYALALVKKGSAPLGSEVSADVRGRRVSAEAVGFPFYSAK
jgi:aminomethyltransferase